MLRNIRTLLAVWIRRVVSAKERVEDLYAEHQAIFLAIKSGDPAAAGAAMERHLLIANQRLTAGLEAERTDHGGEHPLHEGTSKGRLAKGA
jgi:GntR family transcriptional repressor for pyruvate dehydrogenase complex